MKINISIDDICPHPKSSTKVLKNCYSLIDRFPDIKFTLFIPMAYTRLNEKSYYLKEYPDFCDVLRNLDINHFELGWHGFLHGVPGISNNNEFRDLDFFGAKDIFNNMFKMAEDVGLENRFVSIFRPPAFWLSEGSFMACKFLNINILALSPYIKYSNQQAFKKIIYFDCLPPIYPLLKKDKIEIVYHASEWNKNVLNDQQEKKLVDFISNANDDLKFVFMEDF